MLTKSDYITGLTCHKLMWISKHDPSLIPEPDESETFRMEQGIEVGKLAQGLYPNGVSVEDRDKVKCAELTKSNLNSKKTLFEAGFIYDGIYCRVDILNPVGNKYDIIEVKSVNSVKDEHKEDVAFQKFVLEKSGLTINRCFVLHLNKDYIRNGSLDLIKLFKYDDVTSDLPKIDEEIILDMKKALNSKDIPLSKVSHLCTGCSLWGHCHAFLPSEHVFLLYRDIKKKRGYDLLSKKIMLLRNIPDDYELSSHQSVQKKCAVSGECHIEKEELKKFLKEISEPISYLDFETFSMALPPFDNTHSYQQICFQYSLHVNSKHFEFLHTGSGDPREEFILSLKKHLPEKGTILAYNMSFEKSRISELAEDFPKHKKFLTSLLPRFVDLLIPFRNFWYYSPKQQGSCSIKYVLPALCGKSYSTMDVKNGGQASLMFVKLMSEDISSSEREKIRKALLDYCELDTLAMQMLLEKLKESS